MNIKDVSDQIQQERLKIFRDLISKRPVTKLEIKEELKCSLRSVDHLLKQVRSQGGNVQEMIGEKFYLHSFIKTGGELILNTKDRGDGWSAIGFVTDNHLANKHSRLDVLSKAYNVFAEEGVTTVLNAGNWVDGECKFNRHELVVPPGMDPQLDYAIENYPFKNKITTYYISGDDHEGWWIHRERINVGEYFQMRSEKAGRTDLKFIGHLEADIRLRFGKASAVGRLMHPGGGSAYALSYAPQKLVESFQGGEKPAILWIGHYHKFDYCFPREVHVISGGCTTDQSAFLRKNKIGVHVGFSILKYKQDRIDGHITRQQVEWIPFYDRGYYERRFG